MTRYLRQAEGSRSAAQLLLHHRASQQDPMEHHVLIHLDRPRPPTATTTTTIHGGAPGGQRQVFASGGTEERINSVRLDKGDNPRWLTTHLRRTPIWHGASYLLLPLARRNNVVVKRDLRNQSVRTASHHGLPGSLQKQQPHTQNHL